MQTFLPYRHLSRSALCLDTKRLGKQRVEAKQILIALGHPVGDHPGNASSRWRNHPAVRMWRSNERLLSLYAIAVCNEWVRRGYRDSLLPQFLGVYRSLVSRSGSVVETPSWYGDEKLHASHRSNLLRKQRDHYAQFGWAESDDLPYYWPVG